MAGFHFLMAALRLPCTRRSPADKESTPKPQICPRRHVGADERWWRTGAWRDVAHVDLDDQALPWASASRMAMLVCVRAPALISIAVHRVALRPVDALKARLRGWKQLTRPARKAQLPQRIGRSASVAVP